MSNDDYPQSSATTTGAATRRPDSDGSSSVVQRLREVLSLDPVDRLKVAVVRVSARGQLDKLDDFDDRLGRWGADDDRPRRRSCLDR
jgi:hypothetical protein